jgi:hypothetical protein
MHLVLLFYILLPSIFGVLVFRVIRSWFDDKATHLKQYANAFAFAAVFWGPLQVGWVYGITKDRDYYVDDRSQPPPKFPPYRGYVYHYPQKLVEVPKYHYGVGYKFSLSNPVAKFMYDQLGGIRLTYVMSFVDVLIIGCIFSAIIYLYRRVKASAIAL